ncbi:MAG: hypothetical protein ABI925_04500 [Verrucomicrobiota bacterium]
MNQPVLLHIVERLEGFVGKLPETIRNPILSELTPLKELFLQQRPPRFLFLGSSAMPMPQLISALFPPDAEEQLSMAVTPVHRWTDWNLVGRGTIAVLDAREATDSAKSDVDEELQRQPADVAFIIGKDLEKFAAIAPANTKIIGVLVGPENGAAPRKDHPALGDRLLQMIRLESAEMPGWMPVLTEQLPNEAKIEMIRISRDREAQQHVAQVLVKSTTAICTAIGTQPIPLADMPILTTLQLVMVSGIMYLSGRERSLRAATEFVGALGANVGVGMVLREGARAILKFFPGWGNVVCGMVAGAGTYAIGRAAIAYFLEGASLKDARRTYLASRKRRRRAALREPKRVKTLQPREGKRLAE